MKAILKKVGRDAEILEIENEFKALQETVGENIRVLPFMEDVILMCDEEGRIKEKAPNFTMHVFGEIVGDVLFVGNAGEGFRGLTEKETDMVIKMMNQEKEE